MQLLWKAGQKSLNELSESYEDGSLGKRLLCKHKEVNLYAQHSHIGFMVR